MNTSREQKKKTDSGKIDEVEELSQQEKDQMNAPVPSGNASPSLQVSADNLTDDEFLDKMFENMEKKETKDTFELTSNYIDFADFQAGEERNYIFTGFTTFVDDNGETKPAVTLMDKNRKMWVCASIVTVKSLQKIEKTPCPVRIKVNGKVKGKNGSYYDTNVYVL